jgi:hypothetical protein
MTNKVNTLSNFAMERIESLKKLMESFAKDKILTKEDSKLILKMQACLKEHVLQGKCTYCEKNVDKKLFLTLSEVHDYHTNGMCLKCLDELQKEPNKDSKWLN